MNPRGRVLGMLFRFDGGSVSSLLVDSLDLVHGSGSFGRLLPNSMPVDRRGRGSTCVNEVKHELGPIVAISVW